MICGPKSPAPADFNRRPISLLRYGPRLARGFTLLEVMIAIGVLGIALLALLALNHRDLQSVIQAQNLTRAAMLAQALMTEAEMQRFPPLGTTQGDFQRMYPGRYTNFRWQRTVQASDVFPDVRRVNIRVRFGPRLRQSFDLVEFLHEPVQPGPASAPVPGPPAPTPVQQ